MVSKASYTVGGNANGYSHYGEQYGGSLKTKKSFSGETTGPVLGTSILFGIPQTTLGSGKRRGASLNFVAAILWGLSLTGRLLSENFGTPMDCMACQAPLSMEFPRQEY